MVGLPPAFLPVMGLELLVTLAAPSPEGPPEARGTGRQQARQRSKMPSAPSWIPVASLDFARVLNYGSR